MLKGVGEPQTIIIKLFYYKLFWFINVQYCIFYRLQGE